MQAVEWKCWTRGRSQREYWTRCVFRVLWDAARRSFADQSDSQIVLSGNGQRYLAHLDTRAILIDELAQQVRVCCFPWTKSRKPYVSPNVQHHSFASPGKKLQHRLVTGSDGTAPRFYRLERGKVRGVSTVACPRRNLTSSFRSCSCRRSTLRQTRLRPCCTQDCTGARSAPSRLSRSLRV